MISNSTVSTILVPICTTISSVFPMVVPPHKSMRSVHNAVGVREIVSAIQIPLRMNGSK